MFIQNNFLMLKESVEDLWILTFIKLLHNVLQTNSQKMEAENSPTKMNHSSSLKVHMD